MPLHKLSYRDRRIMAEIKAACPCITLAQIARIFRVSPSRVGEIIRESQRKK